MPINYNEIILKPRFNICANGFPHHAINTLIKEADDFWAGRVFLYKTIICAPEPKHYAIDEIVAASKTKIINIEQFLFFIHLMNKSSKIFSPETNTTRLIDYVFNLKTITNHSRLNQELFIGYEFYHFITI